MTYDEVYKDSLEYFNGDELAANVFVSKYCLQDNDGNYLERTPKDMHRRLAKEFARIDKEKFKEPLSEEEIFGLFDKFQRIIPQGSPMYGIGNPYQYVSISNCFVIPSPYDSYPGIMYTDTEITQVSCRRGGVGWDVSKLRPNGLNVRNAAKATTGCVSFMKRFSNTIREVCQGGRRGASLQSISVHHPDILEFIKIKRDLTQVTGSNITVQFTDEFMRAVENDKEYELRWPISKENAKELNVKFPVISQKIKARKVWDEFIIGARDYAEPGACFIDTVHAESTGFHHGLKEISSNPCSEQYLPEYSSCRLILILLLTYVKNKFKDNAYFDYNEFYKDCYLMQRLADNMVDLEIEYVDRIIKKIESDPEPRHIKRIAIDLWKNIQEASRKDRRTGCGFTGLGDTLAALNIKYGSKESIEFSEKMQKTLKTACYECSVDMAKELGTFPDFSIENDIKSKFIQRIKEENKLLFDKMSKYGRRNSVLLTLAPTGSVSCLTGTTSGIEPVFLLEYKRRKKGNPGDKNFRIDFTDKNGDSWQEFTVKHKGLQDWINITGNEDITKSPYWGATANDIDWLNKTKLQSVLQKHIDNGISVTTNLPNNVSYETVSDIYIHSWKNGAKGCTVYRDGCRDGVLVNKNEKTNNAIKRPKQIECDIYSIKVNKEKFFVIVGLMDGPYEVFAGKQDLELDKLKQSGILEKVKRGHYRLSVDNKTVCENVCEHLNTHEEAITRLCSTSLRHGVDVSFVCQQLEKSKGDLQSLGKAIGRCLKHYIPDGIEVSGEECPECSGKLIRKEGCISCTCGFSKCG